MTYRIEGLPLAPFAPLFALDDAALASRGALRVIADDPSSYPCRVSLEPAGPGERVLLVHHVSHDVAGPYRSGFAIYVREGACEAEPLVDRTPPVFAGRTLSLRGFARDGALVEARLAGPDEHDRAIRALFADPAIAYIHAHNAAAGCFAARIERCPS